MIQVLIRQIAFIQFVILNWPSVILSASEESRSLPHRFFAGAQNDK